MCSSLIFITLQLKRSHEIYPIIYVCVIFFQGHAQNYAAQDMTLQLNENGVAILIPEDVLVNTTGTLWVIIDNLSNPVRQYHYDQEAQTLDFINEGIAGCVAGPVWYSYDRNPINKKVYLSSEIIDLGSFFRGFVNEIDCELEVGFSSSYGYQDCSIGFGVPLLFSFDKDGVLYENSYSSDLSTFDIYSNIRTPWTDINFDPTKSGLTYDFENHRLIATTVASGIILVYSVDIETTKWEVLFEINLPTGCNRAKAIEYIGNDMMLTTNDCGDIFSINLVTQDMNLLASDIYGVDNFHFVEDDIPDATISQSQFTCSDVGAQTVDITVMENGIPVNYQSTVNVLGDFSVRNCWVFRTLTIADPNGSDDAVLGDYADTIDIVSSCSSSFTITQDPPPGTLIPHEELVTIILTVTDEFGNTALCQTIGCSDSPLAIEDTLLQNNFVVYPNPSTDQITIANRNNILLSHIEIIDINGRLLGFKEVNSEAENSSLSLSSYSSGVYFVRINTENDFLVKQIIKQ